MLQIGPLKLTNWLIMAPMSGITNLPFRLMVRRWGAGLVTTEMVSAAGLMFAQRRTLDYLNTLPEEGPLSVQIFGSEPRLMATAAEMAVQHGANLVDINMGCPARKVLKSGAGGALLRTPQKVKDIVSAVREACSVPLTVKIRAGWCPQESVVPDMVRLIEDCGADAITIHPRFVTQGFMGKANWNVICETKKAVGIPVIGNGDVFTPASALEMRSQTGCDGVMIGRGAVGYPWIFEQIQDMEKGLSVRQPELHERRALILEHFTQLCQYLGQTKAARMMRGLLLWYTKGLPHCGRFRGAMNRIGSVETLVSVMDDYFDALEAEGP